MVDTAAALEGQYLNAEFVEKSPSKKLVVVDEGNYKETEFNGKKEKKLYVTVEIDKKLKEWRPNQDSIKNMNRAYGTDTSSWVGKTARLQVVSLKGKDSVLAVPEPATA